MYSELLLKTFVNSNAERTGGLYRAERRKGHLRDAYGYTPDLAFLIEAANSGAIGIFLNGLTLAPPVLPCGTNPNAVLVAAPTIRNSWPRTSRTEWLRTAHSSINTWTFTCQYVDSCPITWARS